jgi:hypothetical protein
MRTDHDGLISEMAWNVGVNRVLVQALVCQESSGIPWASRPEDGYYANPVVIREAQAWCRVHRGEPGVATERRLRSMSFGLLQIMGQVAREAGYTARYLTELCDPEQNLRLGCSLLLARVAKLGDEAWVIKSWNAGPGTKAPAVGDVYVVKVQAFMAETPYGSLRIG